MEMTQEERVSKKKRWASAYWVTAIIVSFALMFTMPRHRYASFAILGAMVVSWIVNEFVALRVRRRPWQMAFPFFFLIGACFALPAAISEQWEPLMPLAATCFYTGLAIRFLGSPNPWGEDFFACFHNWFWEGDPAERPTFITKDDLRRFSSLLGGLEIVDDYSRTESGWILYLTPPKGDYFSSVWILTRWREISTITVSRDGDIRAHLSERDQRSIMRNRKCDFTREELEYTVTQVLNRAYMRIKSGDVKEARAVLERPVDKKAVQTKKLCLALIMGLLLPYLWYFAIQDLIALLSR